MPWTCSQLSRQLRKEEEEFTWQLRQELSVILNRTMLPSWKVVSQRHHQLPLIVTRPLRDPGISRDPGIFSKSRSRDSQKSNPGIFRDFQKPLNDCIPRLSTTLIDHNRFF